MLSLLKTHLERNAHVMDDFNVKITFYYNTLRLFHTQKRLLLFFDVKLMIINFIDLFSSHFYYILTWNRTCNDEKFSHNQTFDFT